MYNAIWNLKIYFFRTDPEAIDLITPLRFLLLKTTDPARYNKGSVARWPAFLCSQDSFQIFLPHPPALPTGRLFGRRGPNKKWSVWTNLRPNFGWFWTKGPKRGRTLKKIASLLLSFLILGSPRNIIISHSHRQKLCFSQAQILQKVKITGGGPNFFHQRPNFFPSGLGEKFCKKLATLTST